MYHLLSHYIIYIQHIQLLKQKNLTKKYRQLAGLWGFWDYSTVKVPIHVRNTKNRMDRYTILSKRNLDLLTRYWFECGRPRGILFPNRWTGDYLTVSTLEQVMRRAVAQADISVKATPHSLRHSFATHLMEQGTDQKLIQSLLGHRDPKSTEVYLHVSNKSLMDVESPFDRKEGDQND